MHRIHTCALGHSPSFWQPARGHGYHANKVRGRIQEQSKLGVENDADRQQRDSKLARFRKQEAELLTKIDLEFLEERADDVYAQHDRLVEQSKKRRARIRRLRRRPAMLEGGSPGTRYGGKIDDAPIFVRGSHTQPGDVVPRAFPALLCWQDETPIASRSHESGRRELAEWLVDPRHPLTARVMVNRIWQQLFGFGLVRTPSNFGRLGRQPTHPQLLDYLAIRKWCQEPFQGNEVKIGNNEGDYDEAINVLGGF